MNYEAVVIGGGPGGYVCAIRLGQLGKRVLLLERDRVGGVCLQAGCIPSKALIQTVDLYHRVKAATRMGIHAESLTLNWGEVVAWKNSVVERLTRGIHQLLKGNGVEFIQGEAEPLDAHRLRVHTSEGVREIATESLVIATGSVPIEIPGFSVDGERILDSTMALSLESVPRRMAVIGGGYIGLELGIVYAMAGSQVTIVEMMDQILPGTSIDLVKVLERRLRQLKIQVYTGAMAKNFEKGPNGHELIISRGGESIRVTADCILVTIGRRPAGLAGRWDRIGVVLDDKGFIRVDEKRRTSVESIYAVGDAAGQPMLAHKASHEGEVVAEVIAGNPAACDYRVVPAVIFTDPEIATAGLTEREAKDKGQDVLIGKFPFAALGRAQAMGETDGFVKLITDPGTGLLLGAEIVGPDAGALIAECALAIEMGATARDLALTIHTHPTLPEAVMEAAKAVYGEAIHILNEPDRKQG